MTCICSLAGTAACASCSNNPNSAKQYSNFITWTNSTERTCKNNAPAYLDFLCSECGFVHYHSEANDTGEGNGWNYCPNCGARVKN